jgi:hypothetical protein
MESRPRLYFFQYYISSPAPIVRPMMELVVESSVESVIETVVLTDGTEVDKNTAQIICEKLKECAKDNKNRDALHDLREFTTPRFKEDRNFYLRVKAMELTMFKSSDNEQSSVVIIKADNTMDDKTAHIVHCALTKNDDEIMFQDPIKQEPISHRR